MKALVYHGKHDVRFEDFKDPELKAPTDILVKTELCGICGSDLGIYEGRGASRSTGFCVGHETVGEVMEVGSQITKFKPGDKVMVPSSVGCGDCMACLKGAPTLCLNNRWRCYGLGPSLQGCQAEAVVVPIGDFNVLHMPEGLSADQAILLEDNLPTAYTACKDADIRPGGTVAVVGLGPIGLMAVEFVMAMGAGKVYAIDIVEDRRAVAEKLGATVLAPDQAFDIIREETKGQMLDSVVEAAGMDATIHLALDLAKRRGTVSCLGFTKASNFDFPMGKAFVKGLTFRTGMSLNVYNDEILALLQHGCIHPEAFITHHMPLSAGSEAYRMFSQKTDGALKIILRS